LEIAIFRKTKWSAAVGWPREAKNDHNRLYTELTQTRSADLQALANADQEHE